MIRGLYTGASGMLAAQTQSEIISDNVANIRTPGYKGEEASNKAFPSMLMERISTVGGMPENTLIGSMGAGVVVDQITRMNIQGALQTTDLPTDLALTTNGYFAVETPNGERYTRNGHFQLNSEGMLQTVEGFTVLGLENGPIGPLTKDFTVDSTGMIMDKGQAMGQLRLVEIPEAALIREGQSLYVSNQPVQAAGNARIQQGAVEGSNVDMSGQMVKMITVMRAYEANQKVIQTQDATLDKAVNEIGRI